LIKHYLVADEKYKFYECILLRDCDAVKGKTDKKKEYSNGKEVKGKAEKKKKEFYNEKKK
jgi:hypothetical protein